MFREAHRVGFGKVFRDRFDNIAREGRSGLSAALRQRFFQPGMAEHLCPEHLFEALLDILLGRFARGFGRGRLG
ncbi:MAG: hypothetical protein ACK4N1_01585 [Pseudorhizobium sp.]